jgi:hypothetical protein
MLRYACPICEDAKSFHAIFFYITAFLSLLDTDEWNQLVKPEIKDPAEKPKFHLLCHTTFCVQRYGEIHMLKQRRAWIMKFDCTWNISTAMHYQKIL